MSELEAAGSSGDAAAEAEAEADSPSILDALDEDAMVEVMLAAKAVGALAHLATSSKQVCSTTRSRVPVHLQVRSKEQADLLIKSQARSERIFSACTQLSVQAAHTAGCSMAVRVMDAVKQWPALQQLQLKLYPLKPGVYVKHDYQLPPGTTLDRLTSSALTMAPALRHLRQLELSVPDFGMYSAGVVGQMVQLTRLQLNVTEVMEEDLPDLLALSSLSNLREFKADAAPATQPAAGPAGPWCLPSSLTRLELSKEKNDMTHTIAYWLTHLPGCPQLQHLSLCHSAWQHASAHPSAVVSLLAQHTPRLRELRLTSRLGFETQWCAHAPGLPDVDVPEEPSWRPDAALAALTGLEYLYAEVHLYIKSQADWRHLAQLSCLTRLDLSFVLCAPEQSAGTLSRLQRLSTCHSYLGGHDLGLLLLACPLLQHAEFVVGNPVPGAPQQPARECTQLYPHPSLKRVILMLGCRWDKATQAAEYAALVPVLSSVPVVLLWGWEVSDDADAVQHDVIFRPFGLTAPPGARWPPSEAV